MTNTNTKPTKKENYNAILAILRAVEESGSPLDMGNITYESLNEFVKNEIQLLDNKTAAAKKRAEEKKLEGDALREAIFNTLSDEWTPIDDIVKAINDPDVSKNMITSRLGQLFKLDMVERDNQSVPAAVEGGKARKRSVYRKKLNQ